MSNRILALVCAAALALSSLGAAPLAKWDEILSPPPQKITLPDPLPSLTWRSDLQKALAEAKQKNRPIFVTLRCLPCKQCSSFDKEVLEGGSLLTPLLKQFITVRLTDAAAIDLRILPALGFQDWDLSWWGYFLSPEGRIYGIFGGKDEVSDATRISPEALATTMKRVLAHHYDPRRAGWNIDGSEPNLEGKPQSTTALPGYEDWRARGGPELKKQDCLHCHQVAEVIRQPAIDAGTFDKLKDTQVWPLPENVGIVLDRDDGLLVKAVRENSPAARAGVQAGDSLAMAGNWKLFGQADFRGVLHRGPQGIGSIAIMWIRDGKPMSGELEVADGWRKTVLDWRMSMSQGNIGIGPGFFPLGMSEGERSRFKIPKDGMGVKPFIYRDSNATIAGLKANHMIIAVNGQSPNVKGRSFEWWFRTNFNPGDTITLTVQESPGQSKEITYQLRKD
jgi:hypothetical protein